MNPSGNPTDDLDCLEVINETVANPKNLSLGQRPITSSGTLLIVSLAETQN